MEKNVTINLTINQIIVQGKMDEEMENKLKERVIVLMQEAVNTMGQ
ncbi:MAG: hypothetical protein WC716_02385 [Chitinophagaceae bacterium]|jgi:hypothetical protein